MSSGFHGRKKIKCKKSLEDYFTLYRYPSLSTVSLYEILFKKTDAMLPVVTVKE
jgi:hypothetical protein